MLTIGSLARSAGSTVQTIRHYEQVGLLKPTRRTQGGQRRYDIADIDRLEFILHGRQFGFSLAAIRELLELSCRVRGSCESATIVAQRQLDALERNLSLLLNQKKVLEDMIVECQCGNVASCQVLQGLREYTNFPSSDEDFGGHNNP
jgi:DNA-binding transcriptional MerR regulator